MKKIFTLLALLVAVVTGAQAQESLLSYTMDNENYAVGKELEAGNGIIVFGADKRETSTVAACGYGFKSDGDTGSTKYVILTPSRAFAAGDIITVKCYNTSSNKGGVYFYDDRAGTTLLASYNIPEGNKNVEVTYEYTIEAGDPIVGKEEVYLFRKPSESTYFTEFEITGGVSPDDPFISVADDIVFEVTEKDLEYTVVTEVIGTNLTGSKLTAELSPAVDGMSVELSSSEITNGSIETSVTVIYSSNVNVDLSTTTLILSDGTTTTSVPVDYSALVEPWEQESISDATTWDFADVTGTVQYGREGQEPKEERLYANVTELTYKSTFNAKALTFEGEYAARGGYAQNGTLRFNTTVPGTVKVTFSNTGGSNSDRYCQVNGVTGSVEAVGTAKQTEEFEVAAGDVVITGVAGTEGGNTALRFFKIEFTPSEEPIGVTAEVTFNKYGLGTFYYSDNAFVIPEGVIAATYALNADNTKVQPNMTIEAGGMIAAGVPVVIKGEPNTTYYFNEALDAANAIQDPDNILIGQENAGSIEANPTAEFYYYTLGAKSGVCGFYWGAVDGGVFELGAHKAYLALAADVASNASFVMFDGTVTAINAIQNNEAVAKGAIYNLNGQKVNAQYKGVVIVNGKKQIRK